MSRSDSTRPDPLYDTQALSHRLRSEESDARPVAPHARTLADDRPGPDFIGVGRRVFYAESSISRWLTRQTRSHTNDDG